MPWRLLAYGADASMRIVRARPPRKAARLAPLALVVALALALVTFSTTQASGFWISSQTPSRQQPAGGTGAIAAAAAGGDSRSSAPPEARSVCTDSCEGFARNGVCDEGRPKPDAPPEQQPDGLSVFQVGGWAGGCVGGAQGAGMRADLWVDWQAACFKRAHLSAFTCSRNAGPLRPRHRLRRLRPLGE